MHTTIMVERGTYLKVHVSVYQWQVPPTVAENDARVDNDGEFKMYM